MHSYWLTDPRRRPAEWRAPDGQMLTAWAGRDFEPPSDVGIGSCTFVRAQQHEPGTTIASLGCAATAQPAEPIGGQPVWQLPRSNGSRASWLTIVGGRFVLQASSPELLARALALPGSADAIISLAPVPLEDDATTSDLLLLRPRPAPQSMLGALTAGPAPQAPTLIQTWIEAEGAKCRIVTAPGSVVERGLRHASAWQNYTVGEPYEHRGQRAFDVQFAGEAAAADLHLQLTLLSGQHVFL